MDTPLRNIAQLQFGLYAKPEKDGQIAYLQAKQFDDWGRMITEPDTFINIREKNHLLQDGDVLFVGKGFRHFAWVYHSGIGPAVASSIFFVIKPNKTKIAAIFNLPENQVFFQQLAAGSSIPSIRKNELGEFKIPLLPLQNQDTVITLNNFHNQEIDLTQSIIQHKNELYQTVIKKILSGK